MKLSNPQTSTKTYWSISKIFCNGNEVPLILLLQIYNTLISNLKKKSKPFTPTNNNSVLPTTISHRTEARLTLFDFEDEDIFKIIRSLNISKAYGYDDILIRMIKA